MTNRELLIQIERVVEKLTNLGEGDEEKDKSVDLEESTKGLIQRDFGIQEWDWPQGIGLYGMCKIQVYYGDNRYMDFFEKWYRSNVTRGLPSRNINTTAPYLALLNLLDSFDADNKYQELCQERAEWIMNELPRTKDRGFQHVTSAIGDRNGVALNEGELWIDTLVMAVLFVYKMGIRYHRNDWKQEAIHQFLVHIKYLYNKQNGLFYHGWSFLRNDNFGGIFWCRGNSWFTYGIMDLLENAGNGINKGVKAHFVDTYKMQVDTLIQLQSASGLWHTVLDDPASYEEVSGSAAITAGILKGIKMGILDTSYQSYADKTIEAIGNKIDADGTVLSVSAGTGMGMNTEHYKNIVCLPMAYGQALALLALYEALV